MYVCRHVCRQVYADMYVDMYVDICVDTQVNVEAITVGSYLEYLRLLFDFTVRRQPPLSAASQTMGLRFFKRCSTATCGRCGWRAVGL